jgi:hypothetical protein
MPQICVIHSDSQRFPPVGHEAETHVAEDSQVCFGSSGMRTSYICVVLQAAHHIRVLRQNLQMNQRGERKVGRELPESVAEPEGVDKLSDTLYDTPCSQRIRQRLWSLCSSPSSTPTPSSRAQTSSPTAGRVWPSCRSCQRRRFHLQLYV